MEVYAGFMEYTDHHVGRLLDGLKKLGVSDDTLVYYIIGDNGASAEGMLNGAYNEMANFNGLADLETPEFLMERYDKLGGPDSYNHYAVGWAHAMNTPYQWTKQVASHWGGTRNGTIVSWPNGIKAKGEIRSQFHHVIDVAPTILEDTTARHVVFLPIDLPLLPPSLLVFLLRYARITGAAVTVASVSGYPQTFPAIVDRTALPALQNELDSGRFGCFSAFQAASRTMGQHLPIVAVELLAQTGQVSDPEGRPPVRWLINLNAPADLEWAEALER